MCRVGAPLWSIRRLTIALTCLYDSSGAFAADCATLDRLRSSSEVNFRDIRGSLKREDYYAAAFNMEGAQCEIYGNDSDKYLSYSCRWYVSKDEPTAETAYKELLESTKQCVAAQVPAFKEGINSRGQRAELADTRAGSVEVSYGLYSRWWYIEFRYDLQDN